VLDLGGNTLRGMTYLRKIVDNKKQKSNCIVRYKNTKFWIPEPPAILILDSKGNLHDFRCCDTRLSVHAFSTTCRISVEEFKKREAFIKRQLNSHRRGRCKSSDPKKIKDIEFKKRDCSAAERRDWEKKSVGQPLKIPAWDAERKMKQSIAVKDILAKQSSALDLLNKPLFPIKPQQNNEKNEDSDDETNEELWPAARKDPVFFPSYKSKTLLAENPFLVNNKTEVSKVSTSTSTSSLFGDMSTKATCSTNGLSSSSKNSTSGLFSSTTNNLFSKTSNAQTSLFQSSKTTAVSKAFGSESGNGLFSLAKNSGPKEASSLSSCNLFSDGSKSQSFRQALQMAPIIEDPARKKASLFLNKSESDVVFKIENEEFPARRYVLSENNTFFKNMFASGMKESLSSVIEIEDTKAPTFKAFLEFIYVGKVDLKEDLALDLLKLADKYILNDLKTYCGNYLRGIITLDNCANLSEIADLYDTEALKARIRAFFRENAKKIARRADFVNFPVMASRYILDIYWDSECILGPPFSKLIVNNY